MQFPLKGISGEIRFEIHPILRQYGLIFMQEIREWSAKYFDTLNLVKGV